MLNRVLVLIVLFGLCSCASMDKSASYTQEMNSDDTYDNSVGSNDADSSWNAREQGGVTQCAGTSGC